MTEEQRAFEEWAKSKGFNLDKFESKNLKGVYKYRSTQDKWNEWQRLCVKRISGDQTAFEEWAKQVGYNLDKYRQKRFEACYVDESTRAAWYDWK